MRFYQLTRKQPPILSFFTKPPITRLVRGIHFSDTFVLSGKQLWDKNRAYFNSDDNAATQARRQREGRQAYLLPYLVDWPFYQLQTLNEILDDTFLLLKVSHQHSSELMFTSKFNGAS